MGRLVLLGEAVYVLPASTARMPMYVAHTLSLLEHGTLARGTHPVPPPPLNRRHAAYNFAGGRKLAQACLGGGVSGVLQLFV